MELLNHKVINGDIADASDYNKASDKIDELVTAYNNSESGFQYQVKVNVSGGTDLFFLNTVSVAELKASATTTQYNRFTQETTSYDEDYLAKVEIDRGATGTWIVAMNDVTVFHGSNFSFDIKPYLSTQLSRVRVTFTGLSSGASSFWLGNAQLTTMSLSPSNVEWQKAFVEGTPFNFGSFTITGTLQKNVHVRVTGNGYDEEYIDAIGSRTYASNYYFNNMPFPSSGTGVYKVEIWVESGTLMSKRYSYNIMCVSLDDKFSAELVCVNELGTDISNDASCYLFSYALYNCGGTNGNATIRMNATYGNKIHEIYNEEVNASTGIKHKLNYYVGISADDANIALEVVMESGNTFSHTFVVDNSTSFPSTTGARFVMNPSTRSNGQPNRRMIVNDADDTKTYNATWSKVSFTDGMDGWTLDDKGRSCLAINAGSKVDINYAPLASIGNGKTIEINYKVKNVSDYSENVITIADNPTSDRFVGIRIRPDEICLHSKNKNTEDNKQSYHVQDEKEVNCVIVIAKNYRTSYGNFAQIYVNGVIKCEFAFSDNDSFATNAHILLGSDTADLFVYPIREYDTAFAFTDSHTNFVASLPSRDDKQAEKERDTSVTDDNGDISFDKVKACANYFVVEMTGEKTDVPNFRTWTKKDVGYANVECHWAGHPEWDWMILGVEIMGQGTTSMNYFIWNLRERIDKTNTAKTCYVRYWDVTKQIWGAAVQSKTVKFDGNNHVPCIRLTAKTNYASSTQSHKMGTTAAFNDLHDDVVGQNEAKGRTAVYQEPFYGFQKRVDEVSGQPIYEFIGLYTFGPDKGDKPTFAYDNKDYKSTLITMEGVDHDKPITMFKYPYEKTTFHGENICIAKADGTYDNGLEVGNCCGLETAGNATDDAAVKAKLDTEFKDAYEVGYRNSTFIMGVERSISEINSQVHTFREGKNEADDFRPIQHYELYDANYDLYHYDISSNRYEPTGVNVKTDLGIADSELVGKTLYQKDLYFREKRRERFKANVGQYWDIEDTIFCFVFLVMFCASDNHGKNSYPYRFANKYRWRQDDLDTIFATDNQGHYAKKYSVEFKDFTDDSHSAYVFKGEDSAFWTLIYECFPTEIRQMGNRILASMVKLSSVKNGNTLQRIMGFFNDYYWNKAQNYFTKSAYNNDARYKYEEAFRYYPSEYNPGVDPLEQSQGDSLEAEMYWVERRMIYCMSQYRYGAFADYTDTSLGRIIFRSQDPQSFKLKPAMDLYPCILAGQGGAFYGGRTFDGEECEIFNVGGGNTDIGIMAADYLRSIGDLCKLSVDATTNSGLTISSKRLEDLKVGDVNPSEVTTNLNQLILDNCPSLLKIDARNLTKLTGELNLKNCQRVREVYLGGTDIRSVLFADGCKVQTFQLSNSMTSIILKDLKFLEDLDVRGCATSINTISISGCDSINAFDVLYNVWATPNNDLTYIRITDVDVNGGQEIAEMLYSIALGKNCDGDSKAYHGVDENGQQTSGAPYISGTIHFSRLMSGYAQAIEEYFQYLTIEVDETIVPSASEIGLALDGEASETLYENNLPSSRRFTLSANSEIYKQVTWTTQLPTGVTFASDANGCTINLSRLGMDESNVNSQKTITIVATSKWNNAVAVRRTIYIAAVPLLGITISADNDTMNLGSGNAQLTKVLNPTNTTKGGFVYYDYDHDKLNVSASGVVTAATGDYTITELMAKFRLDEGIVSNILKFYLNDLLLINSYESAFVDLLAYIYQQGWSASANELYAREAGKVTTLNSKLKGKTDLSNFDKFQYFTNVTSLRTSEFEGCTNLKSIKFPPNLLELSNYSFNTTGIIEMSSEKIIRIGDQCFRNCTDLINVYLPSVIDANGYYLFGSCASLQSITLGSITPTSMTNCLSNCTSLVAVRGVKVTSICTSTQGLFSGCYSLSDFSFMDDWDLSGVTNAESMFKDCTSLTEIPKAVLKLESLNAQSMFNGCTSLVLPKMLNYKYLGGVYIFRSVPQSEFLALPSLVSTTSGIELNCKSIDIGSKVVNINVNTVRLPTNESVNFAVIRAITPPTIASAYIFNNTWSQPKFNIPVYVPSGSVDAYKAATGWSSFTNILPIGGAEWEAEFGSTFAYADYLKYGVDLPDLNEGKSASEYMEFLDPEVERICVENWGSDGHITMAQAASVTSLANKFQGNTTISTFPELMYFTKVLEVNSEFYNCTNLSYIKCENITKVNSYLFSGCSMLYCLHLPKCTGSFHGNNVTYCTSLKAIIFGSIQTTSYPIHQSVNAELLDVGSMITNLGQVVYFGELANLVCRATIPPSTTNLSKVQRIFIPSEYINAYKSATIWSDSSTKIFAIGGAEWISEFGSADEYADYDKYGVPRPTE